MILSKDGRLLYVSIGYTLRIINTVEGKVVKRLTDLPLLYRSHADYLRRGQAADPPGGN